MVEVETRNLIIEKVQRSDFMKHMYNCQEYQVFDKDLNTAIQNIYFDEVSGQYIVHTLVPQLQIGFNKHNVINQFLNRKMKVKAKDNG